jgi:DNA-binding CsgD family transcriptional regulator
VRTLHHELKIRERTVRRRPHKLTTGSAHRGGVAWVRLVVRQGLLLVLMFEDFVAQSEAATTVSQLRGHFERFTTNEGFENHFIGRIVSLKIIETGWVEFPKGHFETYVAEEWDRVDPILGFAATAMRPFCWNDVAAHMTFSRDQTALLDECKRVGVHSIIVAPFPNPNGGCDIVGLSKRHPGPLDRARVAILQVVYAQTWCRYADLIGGRLGNGHEQITLTSRELEILTWVKDGKSNSEISEIMNLSVKTIEYHVGNILKKLGATNRTTAVVIALKHRLLAL